MNNKMFHPLEGRLAVVTSSRSIALANIPPTTRALVIISGNINWHLSCHRQKSKRLAFIVFIDRIEAVVY